VARIPPVRNSIPEALGFPSPWPGARSRTSGRLVAVTAVAAVFMTVGTFWVAARADVAAADSVTATINIGHEPTAIAVNPAGTDAYTTNWYPGTVSVIDLATNAVTATIPVGGSPNGVAVNSAGTDAYVTNSDDDTVSVIDLATNTVTATIPVGAYPYGLAVNPAGTDAYVANTRENTLSIIDLTTNTVTSTIPVGNHPIGLAVNPAGTNAYVANVNDRTVSVVDLATNSVTATIRVGGSPAEVALNPAGTSAYVTNSGDDMVSVIDLATNTVRATIPLSDKSFGLAVNPAGTDAYVTSTNTFPNEMWVIDLGNNAVTATVALGNVPSAVAVNPAATDAYVPVFSDSAVYVVALEPPAPGTPGRPTATDGDHRAIVTVTGPITGGTPSYYTVTAADTTVPGHGGQACTVAEAPWACTLTGLTNGDTYTFTTTATNTAGTSAPSPASNPVTPTPPADLSVILTSPADAGDGTTFIETVTVTDQGPEPAAGVATNVYIPAGVIVTAAPGATRQAGTLDWSHAALAATQTVTYPVTIKVGATSPSPATLGAVTENDGYDPNPANNAAVTTIQITPAQP
jgi:YVTN family beta-propeller protein